MSKVPKAVQLALDEANRLQKEINAPPVDPNAPPVVDPNLPPVVDPNLPPVVDPNIPPIPAPEPPPIPAPVSAPAPISDDYKAKYDTLQGKYNAEVPVLYGEVGDLKIKLAEAIAKITELQKTPAAPPKPVEIPEGLKYIRKEMPGMEEAIVYLAKDMAKQMVEEMVGKKITDVDTKLNNLETGNVKSAAAVFYKTLEDKVKNWTVINEDPDFLKWLDTPDAYSGYKKAELIQDAYNQFDANRVARFFTDYVAEVEAKKPPAPGAPPKFEAPPKGGGATPTPVD